MVSGVSLEVILMRHNQSEANRLRIIQGQSDPPPADGNEDKVYTVAVQLFQEARPIDAVYTSDLKRAKDHARLIADYLRVHYPRLHTDHRVDYFENELLRERARGPLEGARYRVSNNGLTIAFKEGLSFPDGQNTKTFPEFETIDQYLYSLDDPNLGEDRNAIGERITAFRERYLRPYERRGGKLLIMGHSHWINHARNLLMGGTVTSRSYEPLDNLASIRLYKENGQRHYRELDGSPTMSPVNPVGVGK